MTGPAVQMQRKDKSFDPNCWVKIQPISYLDNIDDWLLEDSALSQDSDE